MIYAKWDGKLFNNMVIRESNKMVGLGGGMLLDFGKIFWVNC
jgi:hypothetical protein